MELPKRESTRISGKRPRERVDAVKEFPPLVKMNKSEEVPAPNRFCSLGAGASRSEPTRDGDAVMTSADRACLDGAFSLMRAAAKHRSAVNFVKSRSIAKKGSTISAEREGLSPSIGKKGLKISVEREGVFPSPTASTSDKLRVKKAVKMFHQIYGELKREKEGNFDFQADGAFVEVAKRMKERNLWVNLHKRVGSVPGIEVGHEFCCRMEMVVVGVHCQYRSGIDSLSRGEGHLAVSVVDSGRYANDVRSDHEMIYCGEGGNPGVGSWSHRVEDQELKRGNLALRNSMKLKSPVRVIRKYRLSKEMLGFVDADHERLCEFKYVYEGLFHVSDSWKERGVLGKKIFKFRLIRAAPKLDCCRDALAMPVAMNSKRPLGELIRAKDDISHREWALPIVPHNSRALKKQVCVDDISDGRERVPIHVFNKYDDEKPPPFNYCTAMAYRGIFGLSPLRGCHCVGDCSSEKCSCALKNGGRIPFDRDGRVRKFEPLIYECGPLCKCGSSCTNRVGQNGIEFKLDLFKTPSKGWHVKTRRPIPFGSFVCEYIGEVLPRQLVEQRAGQDDYLFHVRVDSSYKDCSGFTIDASKFGNIGRFINHGDNPNLRAQHVLYDHNDSRMPHIMFFASKHIPPSAELTY